MKQDKNKEYSVKKSSGTQSKELLKTLQKIILQESGSVSYVFVSERIEKVHSNKLKDLKERQEKAILHVNIDAKAIVDKSPNELIKMFETTKWDLGAKYFLVEA
jgi:hypothetical protein